MDDATECDALSTVPRVCLHGRLLHPQHQWQVHTAHSHRVTPERISFVRGFFDVPTILLFPLSCCSQLRHSHRPSVKCKNMQSTRFNCSYFVEDRWKCFRKAPGISGVRHAVWKNKDRIKKVFFLSRPRWKEVAVPVLWPIPEVQVTVFSAPDDGCCDPATCRVTLQ